MTATATTPSARTRGRSRAVVELPAPATSSPALDTLTGVVTLAVAPASGAAVTAGFSFDVPVRFDTDELRINLTQFAGGDIPDIPIVEIRA